VELIDSPQMASDLLPPPSRDFGEPALVSREDIRAALSEFYYRLVMLKRFAKLNSTGFQKLVKFHRTHIGTYQSLTFEKDSLGMAPFTKRDQVKSLKEDVEVFFFYHFELNREENLCGIFSLWR
jgi:SPX domain protein involved in polyphosphate accumulation